MVDILLVRHGRAGSKQRWKGDDTLRPLTKRGRAEALALAELLRPFGVARILTSPLVRCVQTVEPLAALAGVPVERSTALEPEAGAAAVALLRSLAGGPASSGDGRGGGGGGPVVVCTHRETIEVLQRTLANEAAGFPSNGPHEKGSVWVLRCDAGQVVSASYLPPGYLPPGTREARAGSRAGGA